MSRLKSSDCSARVAAAREKAANEALPSTPQKRRTAGTAEQPMEPFPSGVTRVADLGSQPDRGPAGRSAGYGIRKMYPLPKPPASDITSLFVPGTKLNASGRCKDPDCGAARGRAVLDDRSIEHVILRGPRTRRMRWRHQSSEPGSPDRVRRAFPEGCARSVGRVHAWSSTLDRASHQIFDSGQAG